MKSNIKFLSICIKECSTFQFSCKSWASFLPSSWRQGRGRCKGSPRLPLSSAPSESGSHRLEREGLGLSPYLFYIEECTYFNAVVIWVTCVTPVSYNYAKALVLAVSVCGVQWFKIDVASCFSSCYDGCQSLFILPLPKLVLFSSYIYTHSPSSSESSSNILSHSWGMSALTWQGQRSFNAFFLFLGSGS